MSANPYEGPYVGPGSKIAVQIGDELIEDTVHTVLHTSGTPTIYRDMKWWETLLRHRRLRSIVPARFRQPIKPVRVGKSASTQIVMAGALGEDSAERRRARAQFEQTRQSILETLERLGVPFDEDEQR